MPPSLSLGTQTPGPGDGGHAALLTQTAPKKSRYRSNPSTTAGLFAGGKNPQLYIYIDIYVCIGIHFDILLGNKNVANFVNRVTYSHEFLQFASSLRITKYIYIYINLLRAKRSKGVPFTSLSSRAARTPQAKWVMPCPSRSLTSYFSETIKDRNVKFWPNLY